MTLVSSRKYKSTLRACVLHIQIEHFFALQIQQTQKRFLKPFLLFLGHDVVFIFIANIIRAPFSPSFVSLRNMNNKMAWLI